MFGRISSLELIIIIVILLLFFGARKLPNIARSLGELVKELRKSFRKDDEGEPPAGPKSPELTGRHPRRPPMTPATPKRGQVVRP